MSRLSQAIAEGDGISILVEVFDADAAGIADRQGADGLVVSSHADAIRAWSQLPLLHLGSTAAARAASADAVVVSPDASAWEAGRAEGLECVVRVASAEDLERALVEIDPEVFLLSTERDSDDDPLEALLALLHDVPAGKLAVAELRDATAEDVAELERAGVDAVLVTLQNAAALIPVAPPEV